MLTKPYGTSEEHRAHVNGAMEVINSIMMIASDHWRLGRENLYLDFLRNELIKLSCLQTEHTNLARYIDEHNKE